MRFSHLGSDGRNFWGYATVYPTEIDDWDRLYLNRCLQTTGPEIWVFWGSNENSTFRIKKGQYNNRFVHNMRRKIRIYTQTVWNEIEVKDFVEQQVLIDTLKNGRN